MWYKLQWPKFLLSLTMEDLLSDAQSSFKAMGWSKQQYKMENAWIIGSTNALGCCSDQWWDFLVLSPEVPDSLSQKSLFRFVIGTSSLRESPLVTSCHPLCYPGPSHCVLVSHIDPVWVFEKTVSLWFLSSLPQVSDGIATEMWTLFPIWPVCVFFSKHKPFTQNCAY